MKMQILKNQYPQGNYTVIMNDKDPEGWVQETIAFSKKVDGIDELAFTGHGNTYTKFFNAIDTWEEKVNSLTLMNNDGHIYIGGCNDASGEFRQTNLRIVHRNHFGLQGVEGSVTAARGLNFGLDFRYSFVMEIFRIISPGGGFLFCASFESHEQYRLTETIEDGSKNLLELFIQGDQYTYPPKE